MRQISASIDERLWLEHFRQRQLVAWQTRTLAAWMVKTTADFDEKSAQTLFQEASEIELDGVRPGKQEAGSTPAPTGSSSPPVKDFYNMTDEEIEQHLGKSENRTGSFEAMGSWLGRGLSRPN